MPEGAAKGASRDVDSKKFEFIIVKPTYPRCTLVRRGRDERPTRLRTAEQPGRASHAATSHRSRRHPAWGRPPGLGGKLI